VVRVPEYLQSLAGSPWLLAIGFAVAALDAL
jgi:hypothetical protein